MKHRFLFVLLCAVLLSSCVRHSERFYFGDYSEAEKLYNDGEYERAIQKYQGYIDQNPEGNMAVISRYYIAKSYVALGRYQDAKGIFQAIMKDHPNVVWANFSETQLEELKKAGKIKA